MSGTLRHLSLSNLVVGDSTIVDDWHYRAVQLRPVTTIVDRPEYSHLWIEIGHRKQSLYAETS